MKEHVTPKRWVVVVLLFVPAVLLLIFAWLGDKADDGLNVMADWATRVAPNRFTRE